ncbi:YcnI family protein [Streptomyces sp. RB6PN25]|uniref:YcnI family protein n=1 Tax=Streptomyces humicola TaxID=2953240 RepID=A0ABT1PZR8_9ACTN|nr:YcnI family protein [Streptomyces humicola]MCQ4083174.1 YcnI family protein [Streptomyces humicola]
MRISPSRTLRRIPAITAAAAATVLLVAGPAFAHVVVEPSTAPKGGEATIDFKVPNEQDNANTVKVEVYFPTDHPIAQVSTEPVPGWTASVTTYKLAKPITTDDGQVTNAVSKITWTGGKIAPGEFQQFPVSVGPLPTDTDKVVFKALQTYDNNQIVRWIDTPAAPGAPDPEHPAPTLTLTPADATSSTASGTAQTTAAKASDGDTTARVLAVVGIVLGAAGVAYGVFAGRRRSGNA